MQNLNNTAPAVILHNKREVKLINHPLTDEKPAKLAVAAYVRVSSSMEDQLNSFSVQLQHYNEFISRNDDWELVDIYAEMKIP